MCAVFAESHSPFKMCLCEERRWRLVTATSGLPPDERGVVRLSCPEWDLVGRHTTRQNQKKRGMDVGREELQETAYEMGMPWRLEVPPRAPPSHRRLNVGLACGQERKLAWLAAVGVG